MNQINEQIDFDDQQDVGAFNAGAINESFDEDREMLFAENLDREQGIDIQPTTESDEMNQIRLSYDKVVDMNNKKYMQEAKRLTSTNGILSDVQAEIQKIKTRRDISVNISEISVEDSSLESCIVMDTLSSVADIESLDPSPDFEKSITGRMNIHLLNTMRSKQTQMKKGKNMINPSMNRYIRREERKQDEFGKTWNTSILHNKDTVSP